jgi:hypothetical protein
VLQTEKRSILYKFKSHRTGFKCSNNTNFIRYVAATRAVSSRSTQFVSRTKPTQTHSLSFMPTTNIPIMADRSLVPLCIVTSSIAAYAGYQIYKRKQFEHAPLILWTLPPSANSATVRALLLCANISFHEENAWGKVRKHVIMCWL